MLCQSCNKNPATTHVTQMVKGKKKQEFHLCESCARDEGVTLKQSVSFSELLSTFIDPLQADPEQLKIVCPNCGISYAEFREVGRLGCPTDYDVFKKNLIHTLDRIHRASQHVGKIPSQAGPAVTEAVQINELLEHLKTAVRVEDYERAAEIRDQLAALRAQAGDA